MSATVTWVNGAFAGNLDPNDRGFTLGDGVFDTMVAFDGTPIAGDRHRERLVRHADAIGIAAAPDRIEQAWAAVLAKVGRESVILRTTVTRGRTERGLWPAANGVPTIVVTAARWSPGLAGRPVRLVTSPIRRNAASPTSRLKTLNYLDNVLAARDAAARGADDALLLNGDGRVACTTIANVFAVFGDRIVTPPPEEAVLSGVVRALVLEASGPIGLRAEERPLEAAELRRAEAVIVTNSVRFISPVVTQDGGGVGSSGHPAVAAVAAAVAPPEVPGSTVAGAA